MTKPFLNLSEVNINLSLTRFLISGRKWYYGIFSAGYNATLGLPSSPKNNYFNRFHNYLKNPRADYFTPEGLDGYFVKGYTLNFGSRKDNQINIFIDIVCIANCIRIYYGLLRVNYHPWSVISFV